MKRKLSLPLLFLIVLFGCIFLAMKNGLAQNVSVTTFDNVHQRFGGTDTRTVVDTFLLPSSLDGFNQILMHIDVSCPPGGCDPWDRFAMISLKRDSEWLEIGRYITPYKKACGWTCDVTDYSLLLTDTVILSSFIDTWVDPGWLVKVTFEYVTGIPAIPLTKVENVWQNYGLVYGDTTQTDTFPVANPVIENDIDSVKLKVVLTGHGQGNTDNAAEFSQKTHHVFVNGISTFSQFLWRSDCSSNSCSPQSGTWTYARAGWCPGSDVIPTYFNLTPYATPGSLMQLDYQLEPYFNECSPNNSACVTGVTCSDCNYNYNGHTQPYYSMSGQLITYLSSSVGINEVSSKNNFSIHPNPAQGEFTISTSDAVMQRIEIFNQPGQCVFSAIPNSRSQVISVSLKEGIYFVKVTNEKKQTVQKIIIR